MDKTSRCLECDIWILDTWEKPLLCLRTSFIVRDDPFWFSLNLHASISMNTMLFPRLGKAIFYLSALLKIQHPNIPLHFIFSSAILLVKRAVKASQETAYIFSSFQHCSDSIQERRVDLSAKRWYNKRICQLIPQRPLQHTDLKQYFCSIIVFLSKYKATPLPSW